MPKTFLLIGLSGSGKSTTGNCILSKSGDANTIKTSPFKTSDLSSSCTTKFCFSGNDTVAILDTVGFGDPNFKQGEILGELKKGLMQLNNRVDCVLFVIKKGRVTTELVEFLELVQVHILKNRCKNNSLLVLTNCEEGWVLRQQDDSNLNRALANCNGLFYELKIRFDQEDDDEEDRAKNLKRRQTAVEDFVGVVMNLPYDKIDLSYVHSTEFEIFWNEKIGPMLSKLFAIGGGLGLLGAAGALGIAVLKRI